MAFRFQLETVLKHRKRLEELAQREFAEAQLAVNKCLQMIEEMYRRSDEVRESIAKTQLEGTASGVEEIRSMELFLQGHRKRIEEMRLRARELMNVAEEKQERLIAAAQDRKLLDKLKEKKRLAYNEWLKQMESKNLDDLTMVRTARLQNSRSRR